MRDIKLFAWLGVWLFVLPFFGVPGAWKERLTALTGFLLLCAVLWAQYRKNA